MTTYLVRPTRPGDRAAVTSLARRVRRELRISHQTGADAGSPGLEELAWVVEAGRGDEEDIQFVRRVHGGLWTGRATGRRRLPGQGRTPADLCLAPEWRGFGLGRALLDEALRSVQQRGALRLECDLPSELAEAAILLERAGFVSETGEGESLVRRLVRTFTRAS